MRALDESQIMLLVGARCVVRDEPGRLLLVKRSDNGLWAIPGGAMEIGESIDGCAMRELAEETGLAATALTPFALYSGPTNIFTNSFGHTYQLHSTAFRVDAWNGRLLTATDETVDAAFFDVGRLPTPRLENVSVTLADLNEFEATGRFVLR